MTTKYNLMQYNAYRTVLISILAIIFNSITCVVLSSYVEFVKALLISLSSFFIISSGSFYLISIYKNKIFAFLMNCLWYMVIIMFVLILNEEKIKLLVNLNYLVYLGVLIVSCFTYLHMIKNSFVTKYVEGEMKYVKVS